MQSEGLTQRKGMAMAKGAEPGGSFGVESFHGMNGGPIKHPDAHMDTGAHVHDGARGIGAMVHRGAGHMPAQSHPDHGPHHHRAEAGATKTSFGVTSLKSAQG